MASTSNPSQIVAGSVVRLKSGGPNMTASGKPTEYNSIKCYWFLPDHTICEKWINADLLDIVDET